MIIALNTVIVGDKVYREGETVSGLSGADIRRMESEGFIRVEERAIETNTETAEEQHSEETETPTEDKPKRKRK